METINEMISKLQFFSSFLALLLGIFFGSAFMDELREKKYQILTVALAFVLASVGNEMFWIWKDAFVRETEVYWQYEYGKNLFFIVILLVIQWICFRRRFIHTIIATTIYVEILMIAELIATFIRTNVSVLVTYQEVVVGLQSAIVLITVTTLLLHGGIPKIKLSPMYLLLVEVIASFMILMNWLLFGGGDSVILFKPALENYFLFILLGCF